MEFHPYRPAGGAPAPLPALAIDANGAVWSDLAGDAEARAACGWVDTPSPPTIDTERQRLGWDAAAEAWTVEAIVPQRVSAMQARLALAAAGRLEAVEAAIAAAGHEAQLYWAHASHLHRNHPLISALAAAIPLSGAELDALFQAAAELS